MNLDLKDVPGDLAEGIYACRASLHYNDGLSDGPHPAAMHFGPRTMFGDTPSCEVHVIDFAVPDHPAELVVEVVSRLRDVREFASVEELKEQMREDIEQAKELLHE